VTVLPEPAAAGAPPAGALAPLHVHTLKVPSTWHIELPLAPFVQLQGSV
jgi:hypothetical protein